MKNIITKVFICCMVCMISFANGYTCQGLTKGIKVEESKTIDIDTSELRSVWFNGFRPYRLKIRGRVSKENFFMINLLSFECEAIDMSDLEIEVIPHESFLGREKLKEVILPKCLKKIEFCCFSECYNLETVVLPKTLKQIRFDTFLDCPKLRLEIPSNIKIDSNKFHGSSGVTIVEVEPEPICGCWTRMWQWISDLKEKTF